MPVESLTAEPRRDCPLRPRLVALRETQRIAHPDWHNAPAQSFGDRRAWPAIAGLAPGLRVVIALGRIAHQSAVKAFGHGAEHRLPGGLILLDSYHCSRYNQNIGRLTGAMFKAVFARAVALREGG